MTQITVKYFVAIVFIATIVLVFDSEETLSTGIQCHECQDDGGHVAACPDSQFVIPTYTWCLTTATTSACVLFIGRNTSNPDGDEITIKTCHEQEPLNEPSRRNYTGDDLIHGTNVTGVMYACYVTACNSDSIGLAPPPAPADDKTVQAPTTAPTSSSSSNALLTTSPHSSFKPVMATGFKPATSPRSFQAVKPRNAPMSSEPNAINCYVCGGRSSATACDDPLNETSPEVGTCTGEDVNTCLTFYLTPSSTFHNDKPFTDRNCMPLHLNRGSMNESKCYDMPSSLATELRMPGAVGTVCFCDTNLCNGESKKPSSGKPSNGKSSSGSTKTSPMSMYINVLVAACLTVVVFRG